MRRGRQRSLWRRGKKVCPWRQERDTSDRGTKGRVSLSHPACAPPTLHVPHPACPPPCMCPSHPACPPPCMCPTLHVPHPACAPPCMSPTLHVPHPACAPPCMCPTLHVPHPACAPPCMCPTLHVPLPACAPPGVCPSHVAVVGPGCKRAEEERERSHEFAPPTSYFVKPKYTPQFFTSQEHLPSPTPQDGAGGPRPPFPPPPASSGLLAVNSLIADARAQRGR